MSRPGRPWENGQSESLLKTLKLEEIDARPYRTMEELEEHLAEYIEQIYNKVRLHSPWVTCHQRSLRRVWCSRVSCRHGCRVCVSGAMKRFHRRRSLGAVLLRAEHENFIRGLRLTHRARGALEKSGRAIRGEPLSGCDGGNPRGQRGDAESPGIRHGARRRRQPPRYPVGAAL
jgi:hypothetical protein